MYSKEWIEGLRPGTQLVFGESSAEIFTVLDKPCRKNHCAKILSIPNTKQQVKIYFDFKENRCRMKYPDPNWDFPLEGRLLSVIAV